MKSLLLLISLYSQYHQQNLPDSAPHAQRIYSAIVIQNNRQIKRGYLTYIDDSVLNMASNELPFSFFSVPDALGNRCTYSDIHQIILRRKGRVGRGILFGALTGFGVGAFPGLISGDDKVTPYRGGLADVFIVVGNAFTMTAGEKAISYGFTSAVTGASVGIILGAIAKRKFTINGKKQNS